MLNIGIKRPILLNKTPRILKVVLGARLMPLSKATSVENRFFIVLGPNMINSVLSVFNCRKFLVIQALMSLRPEVAGADRFGLARMMGVISIAMNESLLNAS